ncbi:MAG: ATP synthase F1 subunit epsilon [Candidatus Aminicenantes bacterium]|nr:MAG: ATP synthase F1 subunit epsilon [Candidatus Aminicenantes bacterium]
MADTIQLEIVTAAEPAIKASIKQLYLPAYLGKAGVLEDHKPYITLIKPGEIYYTDIKNKNHYLYIREGFMEVNENKIVIISDAVERGEALDKEEVENKLAELDKTIKASVKLVEGMTEEEMIKMPDELAQAIEKQTEFETKLKIIQKMTADKR